MNRPSHDYRSLLGLGDDVSADEALRTQPKTEVVATYTIQLVGAPGVPGTRTTSLTERWLRETEENLTDLLPAGYSVRIREWDEADESWRSGLWRNTR